MAKDEHELDGMVDTQILVYAIRGVRPNDPDHVQALCGDSRTLIKALPRIWVCAFAWTEVLRFSPKEEEKLAALNGKIRVQHVDRKMAETAARLLRDHHPREKVCARCGASKTIVPCKLCNLVSSAQMRFSDALIAATAEHAKARRLYAADGGYKGFGKLPFDVLPPSSIHGKLFNREAP